MDISNIISRSVFFAAMINVIVMLGVFVREYMTIINIKRKKMILNLILIVSLWLVFIVVNSLLLFFYLETTVLFNVVILLFLISAIMVFEESTAHLIKSYLSFFLVFMAISLIIITIFDLSLLMIISVLIATFVGGVIMMHFLIRVLEARK